MQEKQDIHSYDRRLGNIERALDSILKENKNLILKYKSHLGVNPCYWTGRKALKRTKTGAKNEVSTDGKKENIH